MTVSHSALEIFCLDIALHISYLVYKSINRLDEEVFE